MEGNIRLNINIEGHIVNLFCLFGYFKNMWPFSLTLLSLIKNISIRSCCRTKQCLSFHERGVYFTDDIVLVASESFYDIIMIL